LITIRIDGVDEVSKSILSVPGKILTRDVLDETSQEFSARLRAATPVGYSGKLPTSVIALSEDTMAEVGYEKGVDTAGNKKFDSALRPSRKGRSVLHSSTNKKRRWITVGDLESIAEEAFSAYEVEGLDRLESGFAKEVNRVSVS
jgi:hypothetical protein